MCILCYRMETLSLMIVWSPAGQNPSRAGKRPQSTAFIMETANLPSPKSSPRLERAGTQSSVQPTLTRTQEGTNCFRVSWNGFLQRYRALSRAPQMARLHGPKENCTTSTTSGQLRVTMQSRSRMQILAPKLKSLI